jgi:hypothetical protein
VLYQKRTVFVRMVLRPCCCHKASQCVSRLLQLLNTVAEVHATAWEEILRFGDHFEEEIAYFFH